MRIFVTSMLATALLFFSAASASAIALTLGGANGQTVANGDQVSITVSLDVEGATGITLLSVGVSFDNTRLAYNQGASSTASYTLYNANTAAKGLPSNGEYLQAASTCGGYPGGGTGCSFWVGVTDQVNVDYVATDLTAGTSQGTGATAGQGTTSGGVLATLIFDVIGTEGTANIDISITAPGNVIGLPGGASGTASLAGSGTVVIPEPTTALLVGLGLAGLAVAGRRRA
jgi:hypothetical protein